MFSITPSRHECGGAPNSTGAWWTSPARSVRGLAQRQAALTAGHALVRERPSTSRCDLRDVEVAYRMFERRRQENFFKSMREEFLLDALVDYQVEPEDPPRTIPNPERRALDKQMRVARADLARLKREYGAAAAGNAEQRRPTMRGLKIAHGRLARPSG